MSNPTSFLPFTQNITNGVDGLTKLITGLTTQLAEKDAQIANLQKQIVALTPKPVEPPIVTEEVATTSPQKANKISDRINMFSKIADTNINKQNQWKAIGKVGKDDKQVDVPQEESVAEEEPVEPVKKKKGKKKEQVVVEEVVEEIVAEEELPVPIPVVEEEMVVIVKKKKGKKQPVPEPELVVEDVELPTEDGLLRSQPIVEEQVIIEEEPQIVAEVPKKKKGKKALQQSQPIAEE